MFDNVRFDTLNPSADLLTELPTQLTLEAIAKVSGVP